MMPFILVSDATWDPFIFTAKLVPFGRFAAVAEDSGPLAIGFIQFQIDKDAKLNRLRLTMDDAQSYNFRHE